MHSSSRLLAGKGRCASVSISYGTANAKSLRVATRPRHSGRPSYCSILSSAQCAVDVSHRWGGIARSLFSALATGDEFYNPSINLDHMHDASPRHCQTCTCNSTIEKGSSDGRHSVDHSSTSYPTTCYLAEPLVPPNTPLPPPLPKPEFSFKGRILPPNLLAFDSTEGKSRFLYSLETNHAEAYFPLSQQFLNQMDPAYCGVSTLMLILNALAIDPNVRWRGGWRWYGNESMLLERCCLEEERVRREGITLEQFCGLARCQGVELVLKRPTYERNHDATKTGVSFDQFRQDVIHAVKFPPPSDRGSDTRHAETDIGPKASKGGYFLVASFARSALHQTGDGHFSPVAAYHPPSDSCLVLDVARFKYSPYWVSLKELYDAMIPEDKLTGKSRGWILMNAATNKGSTHPTKKEELEGKRSAACVPLAGTGECICPVEKIKIEFCLVK